MIVTIDPIQVEQVTKTDAYNLVLFNLGGTSVLLKSSSSGHDLPLVNIPKFTRTAQKITTLVRDRWNIPSVLLFSSVFENSSDPVYSAALEAQIPDCALSHGFDWFPVHHAIKNLLDVHKRTILQSNYLTSTNPIAEGDAEPFRKIGWFTNLLDWVKEILRPFGIGLGDFQQLNGCKNFSLVRFNTTNLPVWFKAVGKPNLHEPRITIALTKLFTQYMPSILAMHPTYHGWLMADAAGSSLDQLQGPSDWSRAVTDLAGLQIQSIGKSSDLLEAGCKDLRIRNLFAQIDPYLDVISSLMKQQTKVPPPVLSREELSRLSATLKDAVQSLGALEIPDTLGHSDFNPGNIIVGTDRCAFIDWAEAHVSHPFLTFEYFVAHLRKNHPRVARLEHDFRTRYSRVWTSVASPAQVAESHLFSPLVAVYAYAVSNGVWRDHERLKIPRFQGYLRSLTRRMKQEADLLQRPRSKCLN